MNGLDEGLSCRSCRWASQKQHLDEIVVRVSVSREALVPVDKLGNGIISTHHCGCLGRCPVVAKPVHTRRWIFGKEYLALLFFRGSQLATDGRWAWRLPQTKSWVQRNAGPLIRCRGCSKGDALVRIW
jgi:hypothetical protein